MMLHCFIDRRSQQPSVGLGAASFHVNVSTLTARKGDLPVRQNGWTTELFLIVALPWQGKQVGSTIKLCMITGRIIASVSKVD
ncbi:hypothetical protein L210DRAFT_2630138 [Boletus edulis BED1]|uniref:Uncharacterized protein n=1 Tax=Boletus edulis BED1 TaxID=1328754 RepID=A0AAD4C4B5_BOLED|nr:hypothetical protein L210DRAFT_2630138 [Boletus edulis BED1]